MDYILEKRVIKAHHAIPVKHHTGSGLAILDFDLHPLGNMLRAFASGKASVLEFHKCIRDSDEPARALRYLGRENSFSRNQ